MSNIIEITCPKCKSSLWVDVDKKEVIQHKKGEKQLSSFEELLAKEKKKKESTEETFLSARELEIAKKKKAEELFNKSFKK
jgi:Zn-finger nucleic acid-binding protein